MKAKPRIALLLLLRVYGRHMRIAIQQMLHHQKWMNWSTWDWIVGKTNEDDRAVLMIEMQLSVYIVYYLVMLCRDYVSLFYTILMDSYS